MELNQQSLGFSSERAGVIMALGSFGGFFGSLLGGWLGDVAARRSPLHGRLFVAQLSVLGGMPLWAWMLNPGVAGHGLRSALAAIFTFYLVATWAGVAANRPICAELVSDLGERAQIVSVWLLVEGFTNALLGAPLVGRLTMLFGYRLQKRDGAGGAEVDTQLNPENADALSRAMVSTGFVFWLACLLCWCAMHLTFPADKQRAQRKWRFVDGEG